MNSTDLTSAGVRTVASPAVGLGSAVRADLVVRTAPYAAPANGMRLPVAGARPAVRLRGLLAAAGTTGAGSTGAPSGTAALRFVQRTTPKGCAVAGVAFEHISSTPGDLPPEDPLS